MPAAGLFSVFLCCVRALAKDLDKILDQKQGPSGSFLVIYGPIKALVDLKKGFLYK